MNKGSKVRFINHAESRISSTFTKGKLYEVLAGCGDANPARSDGLLGAYITSDNKLIVRDNFGTIRELVFNESNWSLVYEAPSNYVPKPQVNVFIPNKMWEERV